MLLCIINTTLAVKKLDTYSLVAKAGYNYGTVKEG